jgi:site-specific DNA-methyltransferase (adenine-specific)
MKGVMENEIQYLPIDSIIMDDIQFNEELIKPIRESIALQGCHHPLIVQIVPERYPLVDFEGGKDLGREEHYKIIAGRKRFRALQQLGTKEVPVKILNSNLTDQQCREISLHENLRRYNLPWYELVVLEESLHNLRIEQNGKLKPGPRLTAKTGWSMADSAKELGIALGVLSEDLQLARAVKANPSLSKVKDKTTALKLIKTEARRVEDEAFSLIPSEFEMDQVFLGDSLEILKQFPASIFDACITDPPWSQYARDESLTAEPIELLSIFREVFRVLKNDSFLYLICSSPDFEYYRRELPSLGFTVQDYPLIWQKTRTITHGRRNWQYSRDYEPMLLAVKGNPVLTSSVEISSIMSYPNLHYTKMIHPHEKPIDLLFQMINNCTYVGGKVLDPFSGSGVTLEAAKKLDRKYIGIEKNQEFYNKIVRRLETK